MKIYVAGPLSSPTTVGYLRNMARMVSVAVELWRMGHAPYIPALDFLFAIVASVKEVPLTLEDLYELNYPWLEACDAVFMIAPSPGTDLEVARARKLGIPVYTTFEEIP